MSTHLVVVSVGTDHHPFVRLVTWVAAWAGGQPDVKVVVQHGTALPPDGLECHEMIPHRELRSLFELATVVVSHGGPSTVMDARMAGKLPVVVPRDPSLGEHVDDHQLRFADHLARRGQARLATTEAEFGEALGHALREPSAYRIPRQDAFAAPGVIRFGRVVDDLLGTTTALVFDE